MAAPALSPAWSGEPAPGALPGVDAKAGKKVVAVSPVPKKEADQAPDGEGWVRVGDWDVKISGSVQIDIGVGNRPFRSGDSR